MNYKN